MNLLGVVLGIGIGAIVLMIFSCLVVGARADERDWLDEDWNEKEF